MSGCSAEWKNLTVEQKMEDFNYLFSIFEENHPYLALKARVEGYDWLSHRQEFEQAVRVSSDDKSFAQAIAWILRQVNNGHTNVVPETLVKDMANWNEEPWKDVDRQTSPARITYWYELSYAAPSAIPSDKYPPFLAVYNGGKYVVVAVAPDEAIRKCVQVGMTVLQIDGLPVQEHVAGQRGLLPYRQLYDPVRKCLYQRELLLPAQGESLRVTLGDPTGQTTEVQVPYASGKWNSAYPWPPRYAGKPGSPTPNLCTDVLADGKVGYVQIANFFRTQEDTSALRRFFEQVRDLPALIIDIRGNPGGQSTYWTSDILSQFAPGPVGCSFYLTWRSGDYVQPFVQAKMANIPLEELSKPALVEKAGPGLACNIPPEILTSDFVNPQILQFGALPQDSIGCRGKVFLLVDDLSYSAAEGFAAFCKASGFATVVGTWTGGDGIAFTPALVTLPNSGMVVRFPLVMGLNPDFTANEEAHTSPDVMVEQNLDDILAYLAKQGTGGDARPDPSCDAGLRMCLALALAGTAR